MLHLVSPLKVCSYNINNKKQNKCNIITCLRCIILRILCQFVGNRYFFGEAFITKICLLQHCTHSIRRGLNITVEKIHLQGFISYGICENKDNDENINFLFARY